MRHSLTYCHEVDFPSRDVSNRDLPHWESPWQGGCGSAHGKGPTGVPTGREAPMRGWCGSAHGKGDCELVGIRPCHGRLRVARLVGNSPCHGSVGEAHEQVVRKSRCHGGFGKAHGKGGWRPLSRVRGREQIATGIQFFSEFLQITSSLHLRCSEQTRCREPQYPN